jgi:hypothetical protein
MERAFTGLKSMKISAWLEFSGERRPPRLLAKNLPPNNALQRTRAHPAGGRSPLSFETFGNNAGLLSSQG